MHRALLSLHRGLLFTPSISLRRENKSKRARSLDILYELFFVNEEKKEKKYSRDDNFLKKHFPNILFQSTLPLNLPHDRSINLEDFQGQYFEHHLDLLPTKLQKYLFPVYPTENI